MSPMRTLCPVFPSKQNLLLVLVFGLLCLANVLLACPTSCLCYRTLAGPTVRCNHQNLSRIPVVPQSTVVLDLRFNNISSIRIGDLRGLRQLTTLLLSNNRIETIEPGAFTGLIALKYLYLFNNKIAFLSDSALIGLSALEQLYLHFNDLERISPESFAGLNHLERLYLHHNKLRRIPSDAFRSLTKLRRLRLDSNELVCHCQMLWLARLLKQTPDTETAAACYEPVNLKGTPLIRLTPEDLNCIPPKFVKKPANIEVSVNDRVVSLTCKATGQPAPQITWRKDRQSLPQDGRHVVRADGTLDILEPKADDAGVYECMARNDAGLVISEASLRYEGIEAVPKLTRFPPPRVEAIEGNAVIMQCQAQGHPRPVISWRTKGAPVNLDSRVTVEPRGDLRFTRVHSRDGGVYRCLATNKAGSVVSTSRLVIKVPPRFVSKPRNSEVLDGNTASLECNAEGYPAPAIAWTKDGDRLPSQDRHIVLPSGTLRIVYARSNDQGQYECQAINVIGVKLARAFLTVLPRVPPSISDPPTDTTASQGDSVEIKCLAHGAPSPVITWIKDSVHLSVDSVHYDVSSSGTLTIRDISKGDEGRYQCAARNSVGFVSAQMRLTVRDSKGPGDEFANSSLEQAIKNVDDAIKRSIEKMFKSSQPKTPSDLLTLFRFPSPQAREIARSAEIFERTIQLIHDHVESQGLLNISDNRYSFFDLVSPSIVNMIANLSGCSAHRRTTNCSADMCFHRKYRTHDGTCNNLAHPMWGASLTPFNRLLSPTYENGFYSPIGWRKTDARPSARLVSRELVSAGKVTDDDRYTHMLMQWGQFLDHDLDFTVTSPSTSRFTDGADCTSNCENQPPCFPIPIPEGDPRIRKHRCMQFTRSSSVCGTGTTSVFFSAAMMREQMNQITSFMDASNVYGNSEQESKELRDLNSRTGLMKTSSPISEGGKPLLPFNRHTPVDCLQPNDSPIPCFLAGDHRANEQLGLLSMHTLWMREHNRIATELARINPGWGGDQLYHEARKIVGAQLQHITYNEWLPEILGPRGMALLGRYNGYSPNVDPTIFNAFATAAFRFGHSLINPIIFRLNESFQEIKEGNIPLHKAFFSPYRIVQEGGIDPVVRGLIGRAAKSQADKHALLNTELTERLFEMAHEVALDLGALNIQRGRDHALPGYNDWRVLCNLSTAETFEDLKNEITDPEIRRKLKEIYGHPSKVDLWLAGLLEDTYKGSQLGPVFTCIIAQQFQRLRAGDRFWYEDPATFEPAQLTQIRQATLARVICDNGDNIQKVQPNVFLRVKFPSGYSKCKDIPRVDLRMWKECCQSRNCPARDRSYSLANVFSRLRRSVDNAEYSGEENEVTLDLEEQVRPIQSPRTNERQETPENENLEAQEKGNHYANVSSKPQEEEHLPDDMESDKMELTERLETLERTVSDVSNTVASLQKSLETLRKKVIRKNERSSSRTVCKVGKKQYRNGVKWSKDACTACECRDGQVLCTVQQCPEIECEIPYKASNECCTRCLGSGCLNAVEPYDLTPISFIYIFFISTYIWF